MSVKVWENLDVAGAEDLNRWEQAAAFGAQKPTADEKVFYVTPRGDDANDGLTLKSAKATIAAANAAQAGTAGRIQLGFGSFPITDDIAFVPGTALVGCGRGMTTIPYTGAGTVFGSSTPGVRGFNGHLEDFTLTGPGKTTSTVGISLDSVTDVDISRINISLFGTGIKILSAISGGAVYNTLSHVNATSCGIGFDIEGAGSNNTRFIACKANACTTGLSITDSNNTQWFGGSFETCTTGVLVTANSPASADFNLIFGARFEGNGTPWNIISSNVSTSQVINPQIFGTYTPADSGDRTQEWGLASGRPNSLKSALQSASGCWRFERTINGGASLPAFVVRDGVSTTGTPVTIQAETERSAGSFFRGLRGGNVIFDVRADGVITGGSGTTRPSAPIAAGAQWFDSNLGKPIWWNGTAWIDLTTGTVPITTVTANYTAKDATTAALADSVIIANGAGAITISLPDPTTVTAGRPFTVKNISAIAATLVSLGTAKTIDGAASLSLVQWQAVNVISDGTQWLVV